MSTIFLLSRAIDPSRAIPHADVDVMELVREPRITAAKYAGVTDDGAALTVHAETARTDPEGELRIWASGLQAEIEMPDGFKTSLSANEGNIDRIEGVMTLTGQVRMAGDHGYRISTDGMTALLDRTRVSAENGVEGSGPPGSFTADNLLLTAIPDSDDGYVLVFSGNVRLIYIPEH